MPSVVSSQYGTWASSRASSTLSGGTERDSFLKTVTPENYDLICHHNETMKRENALFIEYARRKNKELFPPGAAMESGARMRRSLKRRGKMPQFPINRKLEMANNVISQIEQDIKTEERRSVNQIAEIKAREVQIVFREKEIDKEIALFTREVMEEGRDHKSGVVIGEKLLKWYDDTIKAKDAKIGKLKLKRDSMKAQIARTRARLKQKEEIGERRQQVDYDQLLIKNEGYQAEIAELSQKLAALQKISSSVVSKLNIARDRLANEEKQVQIMTQGITTKENAINKYLREAEQVEQDHRKLVANNEDLASKKSEYRVPDVADYIEKKAKIYELSKVIRNWERKVQLAEMNVKRLRKDLQALDTPRRS